MVGVQAKVIIILLFAINDLNFIFYFIWIKNTLLTQTGMSMSIISNLSVMFN
jgi:hypothetical protein